MGTPHVYGDLNGCYVPVAEKGTDDDKQLLLFNLFRVVHHDGLSQSPICHKKGGLLIILLSLSLEG